MERYMGYNARHNEQRSARQLPIIDIAGTLFQVDIEHYLFRQVDQPDNVLSMINVKEESDFSHLLFDTKTKNIYVQPSDEKKILPEHVKIILVPLIKEMDPIGLARRHGLSDDYYKSNVHTSVNVVARRISRQYFSSNHSKKKIARFKI